MKKIHWGILSAANIAYDQLLPALRRSNRAEVVVIASSNKKEDVYGMEKYKRLFLVMIPILNQAVK